MSPCCPAEADDEAAFRAFWRQLSTHSLARAYGPDEPEYTDADLKERNPLYDGR